MHDLNKTNAELRAELAALRKRLDERSAWESEHQRLVEALRESEERYRTLFECANDAIFVESVNDAIIDANPQACALLGYTREELRKLTVSELLAPEVRGQAGAVIQKELSAYSGRVFESIDLHKDGRRIPVEVSTSRLGDTGLVYSIVRDITQRKQAEEQQRWTGEVNAAIAALYQPLTAPGATIEQIATEVLNQARSLTSSKYGYVSEIDPITGSNIAPTLTDMIPGRCAIRGAEQKIVFNAGPDGRYPGLWGESMNTHQAFFTNAASTHPAARGIPAGHIRIERFLSVPVLLGDELVGQISLANPDRDYTESDLKAIQRLSGYYALAIIRLRKEQELHKTNEILDRGQAMAHLASWEYHLATRQMIWSKEMYQIVGFPRGARVTLDDVHQRIPPGDRERVIHIMDAAIASNGPFRVDFRIIRPDGQERFIHDEGLVLCNEAGTPLWMYGTMLDVTERRQAEMERQKQIERLEALHEIDKAVAASQDLHVTLDTLLRQVTGQLKADAADILLYDAAAQSLDFARGCGFRTPLASRISLKAGRGFAGQAVLSRRQILFNPLPEEISKKDHSLFAQEGFEMYVGLPLISKGQVKGVLEVFHRSQLLLDQDWLAYLEILAGQAAIAIDNLQMLQHLQRANTDLGIAYDTTIEGWSRALDLRDKETEGHSRRVMELTVRMAQAMGIHNEKLVNAYYGALLHDIGKMGVPDEILHKPSSLTAAEWEKMRQHPTLAFELLSHIPYLRNALEIPYCHHEKWDGSGYPRGLRGVQIPLSARIFAVVDVWDALLSDRPYRPAWSKEKALAYIQEQAGQHFDPEVVEMFLDVIKEVED